MRVVMRRDFYKTSRQAIKATSWVAKGTAHGPIDLHDPIGRAHMRHFAQLMDPQDFGHAVKKLNRKALRRLQLCELLSYSTYHRLKEQLRSSGVAHKKPSTEQF